MNNIEIINEIRTKETGELSNYLEELFSETMVDEDVIIGLLVDDIQEVIFGYNPENNYGTTPKTVVIKGVPYKVSTVLKNLKFAIKKLLSIQNLKNEETAKLVFSETDLPEFLSDEQLMELLSYSKSTISTKRSRGQLPQTNAVGLTAKIDLFNFLRDTTPGYMSAEEKVQQKKNKRRKG